MSRPAISAEELRDAWLFAALDDQQINRVLGLCRRITLDDGQTLFQTGEEARKFYLVSGGRIKLSRISLAGNEKVIELFGAGCTFAEALMFLKQPSYPVNATAIGPTELITIDNRGFIDLLRESMDTCFRMMADMSMRQHNLIKEIGDLTLQNASERVAGFLCGLYRQHRESGGSIIPLDAPKGVIASRLSVTPETFSRILHGFTDRGLIRVHGSRVEIIDPNGLVQSAGVLGCNAGQPQPQS